MIEPGEEWLARRIVEQAPEAIVFADRDGVVRLWNEGAAAMFGYTSSEAVGRTLDLIVPEKLRERHWEGYRRVMETGVTRYGKTDLLAVPALRKDGARISIEFSISLLKDRSGSVLGAAAIIRDVSERWQREKETRERLAALEGSRRRRE